MKYLALLLCIPCAWTQVLKLDHLDRLGSKAENSVNITLDSGLLNLAARFIPEDDADAAQVKKLVSALKGISVRSFEFKNAGDYTGADVDEIRVQLRDPAWKSVVEVHSKTEGDSNIWLKTLSGRIIGLALIAAEPKKLTIVSIDGAIDPEDLGKMGGYFGIPKSIRYKSGKDEDKK
jgi:hypothetical protein